MMPSDAIILLPCLPASLVLILFSKSYFSSLLHISFAFSFSNQNFFNSSTVLLFFQRRLIDYEVENKKITWKRNGMSITKGEKITSVIIEKKFRFYVNSWRARTERRGERTHSEIGRIFKRLLQIGFNVFGNRKCTNRKKSAENHPGHLLATGREFFGLHLIRSTERARKKTFVLENSTTSHYRVSQIQVTARERVPLLRWIKKNIFHAGRFSLVSELWSAEKETDVHGASWWPLGSSLLALQVDKKPETVVCSNFATNKPK